jgi:AcrR family transcriptional regulator
MDDIADGAGITKPIIYRHFGDRAGLGRAIAERFSSDLLDELRSRLETQAESRQLLVSTIDAYVAFVENDPNLYRYLVRRGLDEGAGAELAGFIRVVSAEVALVMGELLRGAGADSGAAEPGAHALVDMVHLAADWWGERRTMPRSRLVEYLTALVWDGLSDLTVFAPQAEGSPDRVRRQQ